MDSKHYTRLTYILEKSSAALADAKDTQTLMINESEKWLKKSLSTRISEIQTLSPYTDNTCCLSCSVPVTKKTISEFEQKSSSEGFDIPQRVKSEEKRKKYETGLFSINSTNKSHVDLLNFGSNTMIGSQTNNEQSHQKLKNMVIPYSKNTDNKDLLNLTKIRTANINKDSRKQQQNIKSVGSSTTLSEKMFCNTPNGKTHSLKTFQPKGSPFLKASSPAQKTKSGTAYYVTPKKTFNQTFRNKSRSPQKKLSSDSFVHTLYTGNFGELNCQESMKVQEIFKNLFSSSVARRSLNFGISEKCFPDSMFLVKGMSKYYLEFIEESHYGSIFQQKQLAAERKFVSQLQNSNQMLWNTLESSDIIGILNDCICYSHNSEQFCDDEKINSKFEMVLRKIHLFLTNSSTFESCNKKFNDELVSCTKCKRKEVSGWDTVGVWYPKVMVLLKGFQQAVCISYKSVAHWKEFYAALQKFQILQFEIDVMEIISLDIIPLLSKMESDSVFSDLYECVSSLTSFTSSCTPSLVKYITEK